ncbi:hypothetical protein ILUMI_18498, partial [Ignelater luminosus]
MCEEQNADKSAGGIFGRLCRALSDGRRDIRTTSQEFSALQSNQARVDFAYELLKEYGLFPKPRDNCKNGEVALDLRQEGNNLFKIKKDQLALIKYTDSIAHAENGSEGLSLAYANRSAVLFEHKCYNECLE